MEKWYLTDENFISRLQRHRFNESLILYLIRSRVAFDWASLCKSLNMSVELRTNRHSSLVYILLNLKELGFIHFNDENVEKRWLDAIKGEIKYTGKWDNIQNTLRLSLAELSTIDYNTMVVSPIFNLPEKQINEIDIFVLMPFKDDFKPVYEDHIRNVSKNLNMKVKRADDFFSSTNIIDDVWSAIFSSKILIADCTDRNPNVFYELGIAHTLGKKVIIITQNKDDVPFDINHRRYLLYDYTPRGMKSFEESLKNAIQAELLDEIYQY
jgi:hypothetical protein